MQYINPFSLLGITPQDLIASPKLVRTARKRVLAEIELEERVVIDGIKIERSDALRIIDELDHQDKREFHSLIFYDEDLRDFLTAGFTDWFFEAHPSKYFEYSPFIDFLIPYFAHRFNEVFHEAVSNGDLDEIRQLQKSPIVLEGEFYDLSRQKVKKYFAEKLAELEEKLEATRNEDSLELSRDWEFPASEDKFYNPFAKPGRDAAKISIKNIYLSEKDAYILNELTDDFQDLRNNIARCIQNIAVSALDTWEEPEIALVIFQLAGSLKVGSRLKKLITDNTALTTKIVLKEDLAAVTQLLNKILEQAKKQEFTNSKTIKSSVDLVVDVAALNSISSSENNNTIINIAVLLSDVAMLVNESYFDPVTALTIIDKALEIRIKDSQISAALLKRLVADRYRISLRKELLETPAAKQAPRPKSKSPLPPPPPSPGSQSAPRSNTYRRRGNRATHRFSTLENQEAPGIVGLVLENLKTFIFKHFLVVSLITFFLISGGIFLFDQLSSFKRTTSNNSNANSQQLAKSPDIPAGMVYIPGGEFLMGRSEDKSEAVERPAHQVRVKPFLIDIYETTNEQYAEFIKKTNYYRSPAEWKTGTYPKGQANFPVTGVEWDDAAAYARWKGKRLPTEEEWEFAARGSNNFKYSWGNEWKAGKANAGGENPGLTDIGKYPGAASPFGVQDMVGNAWEWTASDFKAYPAGTLPDTFKGKTNLKTIRGGSFESTKEFATTTYRLGWAASGAENYRSTGFRCVKDLEK